MKERLKRTIIQMLFMFVNENQNDWAVHLTFVMKVLRSTCHDSTKFSSNKLKFCREITFLIDVIFSDCPDTINEECPSQYVEWLRQSMLLTYDIAFQNLIISASRQKKAYDKI
jgi:hypothetical protein